MNMTLILMILSFFLSKKQGASTGTALGIAAGVGAASWFLADPANPNSKWGDKTASWFGMDRARAESVNAGSNAGNLFGKTVDGVVDVAKSWGPAGVAGAAVAASNGGTIVRWLKDHWPIPALLAGLYILTRN